MQFIDEVKIEAIGGNGGPGCVGWRREKFVPQGGPDGGDGGSGGAVILKVDPGLNTLIDFSFAPILNAKDGEQGGTGNKNGQDGADLIRAVPVGTQVFYQGQLIADLKQPNSYWIAARGGHGGKGNTFFKSSTNRSPDYAQPGQSGDRVKLRLVLKSVADVGLVGFPNVGKSTFISKVSRSSPKIADYPFTTLTPNLGVVMYDSGERIVIADIPGLIPGAHEGKGLGLGFLKHVERTAILLHFIDGVQHSYLSSQTPEERALEQFYAIEDELRLFSEELLGRPRIVVFAKSDLVENRSAFDCCRAEIAARGHKVFLISSATGEGLPEVLEALRIEVSKLRNRASI
ncbi:GTPase ObgE [bacterium]|nr:GTPase ObgE [bacterium]